MKTILLCLLAVVALFSQPSTVTISDTVYSLSGFPFSGQVQIALSSPSAVANGATLLNLVQVVSIRNGVLLTKLVPNFAGTSYQLTFLPGSITLSCTFPSSSSSVTLAAYCTGSSTLKLSTLTNPQLVSLTNAQLTTLTN